MAPARDVLTRVVALPNGWRPRVELPDDAAAMAVTSDDVAWINFDGSMHGKPPPEVLEWLYMEWLGYRGFKLVVAPEPGSAATFYTTTSKTTYGLQVPLAGVANAAEDIAHLAVSVLRHVERKGDLTVGREPAPKD